jgi:hypothetical protein
MPKLKKIFLLLFATVIGIIVLPQESISMPEYQFSFVTRSSNEFCDITFIDYWYYDSETDSWSAITIYYGTVGGEPRFGVYKPSNYSLIDNKCEVIIQNNELIINTSINSSAFLYELGTGKLFAGNIFLSKEYPNYIQLSSQLFPYFIQIISDEQIVYQQSFINTNSLNQLRTGNKE